MLKIFKWCIGWAVATIAIGIFCVLCGQSSFAQQPRTVVTWRPILLGAGGQLTGIDIAPDGTMVVKTDTFGAYIWNRSSGRWDQLITAVSWGAMEVSGAGGGVWEIRIAPSLTTQLYMVVDGFTYRSDDSGKHWIKTSLGMIGKSAVNRGGPPDANGPFKFANQKLAVDPVNPDIVYVATTSEGVWRSFDAGATWKRIIDIPASSILGPGSAGIAFDAHSGATNRRTNTIFVPSYGKGVWRSTNGGATWTQIANGDGNLSPRNVWTAQIGTDEVIGAATARILGNFRTAHGLRLRITQVIQCHLSMPLRLIRANRVALYL